MHEFRVSLGVPSHYLVPMVLKGFSRRERLAHSHVRVLGVDVVLVDGQHDNVVAVVPFVLDGGGGVACAPPDLRQRNHWGAVSGKALYLVKREIGLDLGFEAESARSA